MVFSSPIFLFLFLPVFLAVYYATPHRYRSQIILLGSLIFYGWWRLDFVPLMLGVIIGSYWIAAQIDKNHDKARAKKWLVLGVTLNLLTLAIFKYLNFGLDQLNFVLNEAGMQGFEAMQFLLPIGISFYIFHAISFLVDIYRRDAQMPRNIFDFAAFISLFPQLVAGPILRFKDLAWQFENRVHSLAKFNEGARRFMIGFIKKILIADTIAPLADAAFAVDSPSAAESWLGAIAYSVQLYFDFSGYSDMAIGLALMLGFEFRENFNAPYLSRSIAEFWRRWHISLSSWLRDYLYIPLGGNRHGKLATCRNIFITMLLGGLWHGPSWTFILWGALHGAIMVLERGLNIKSWTIAGTMVLVIIGWVMFRAENLQIAFDMYRGMLGLNGIAITDKLDWQIQGLSVVALLTGIAVIYKKNLRNELVFPQFFRTAGLSISFLIAVSRLLAQNYSPFLYFQF